MIHRDIKLENILIRKDFSITLIDFGYGEVIKYPNKKFSRYFGTPYYSPPQMILKKKYKDGKFDKYKARLVVRGYTQVRGEDYHDTYAPVAMAVTLRLFLLLCTLYVLNTKQLDVRAAFLQADVEEDLYAWPPEGFCPLQPPNKKLVYKLKKA